MKRRITKIILYLFCTGAFVVLFFYLWLSNAWRFSEDRSYYEELSPKVKASKPVPDSLVSLYLQAYETEKDNSLTEELFLKYGKSLITGNYKNSEIHNCLCDEIIYSTPITRREGRKIYWPNGFEAIKIAFGLETKIGDEACFHYYLRKEFEGVSYDVKHYPYSFVGKSIDDLTKEEYFEFLVIKKAPTYFSKFSNPERFMQRKKTLEKLIH